MELNKQAKGLHLGLTGGIGCGKSTVAAFFREAGWSVLEADALVRELLTNDSTVTKALRLKWGEAVFDANDEVDRSAIAKLVFEDSDSLLWLEALLHPLVRKLWSAAVAAEPSSNWLVEIPLLFEKSLEKEFDFIVCIESSNTDIVTRMAQRGYSREAIESRSQRQMPLSEKIQRSDFVIQNSGSLDFLKEQTMRLIAELL
jgi:dephospho-CoA kinase